MREALLALIVAVISVVALVKPRVGLFGWVWYALMRPDVLAWVSVASLPYSTIIAVATLIGSLRYLSQFRFVVMNPLSLGLIALQLPMYLSVQLAVHPELASGPYQDYIKMILMVLLIPVLIRTEEDLRWLILVIGVSAGFVGAKFGLFGLLSGGIRFSGGYGGSMSGNNEIGMAAAMTIPVCWYGIRLVAAQWSKVLFAVVVVGSTATVIMTFSRGAALGLVCVALMILLRSKHKIGGVIVIAALIVPSVYLVKESYFDRLATLEAPTEEASANSRIESAKLAVAVWKDYPLLGVGFGRSNYLQVANQYSSKEVHFVVHNTYLQVLVDSGAFSFLIFFALLSGAIVWLGFSVRRARATSPDLEVYPLILQTALMCFAITGTFGSRENYDFYYILLMTAAAWRDVLRGCARGEKQPAAEVEPLSDARYQPEADARATSAGYI
jgi:probable O-glycosylation ligase (exosortase A-associated)